MNDKIILLVQELLAITSESTVVRELEGLLRKHRALVSRKGRRNFVDEEATLLKRAIAARAGVTPRLIAERALARSFSQASVYRLIGRLRASGVDVSGAEVLREMERLKRGIC